MDEKLKQKLIEAVKVGDENQASELLWQLVIDCQNCPFKTVSGLPFSYTIKRGRNGELTMTDGKTVSHWRGAALDWHFQMQ